MRRLRASALLVAGVVLAAGCSSSSVDDRPVVEVFGSWRGVDAERFCPEGEPARLEANGSVVVGFVGSLRPWHGVEVLCQAFGRVAGDPRFHLLVVGDGPERRSVRALEARFPDRVTLTGGVSHEDVPRYLRAMDMAVAPYPNLDRFYFSPLKVLEYMAAGRAVVASGIGQVAELIRDGSTGILVPPGDPDALAAHLRELADDPGRRELLGHAAAQAVRREHLWTHRATEIVERARRAA